MLQVIPSSHKTYSKNSLFISANTYEEYIVSKKYCIAPHYDTMSFLLKCRSHIIVLGVNKELLQKLDAFCINYQHVDCVYTLFKYWFKGKIVDRSGKPFANVQRHVISATKTEEWAECHVFRKRDSWGKITKNDCWAPSKNKIDAN